MYGLFLAHRPASSSSSVRTSVNNFLWITSPTEPMDWFQYLFTGMFRRCFAVVQRISLDAVDSEKGKIAKTLKIFLSKITGPIWKNILHKCSLGHLSIKIVQIVPIHWKTWLQGGEPCFSLYVLCIIFKNFLSKSTGPIWR